MCFAVVADATVAALVDDAVVVVAVAATAAVAAAAAAAMAVAAALPLVMEPRRESDGSRLGGTIGLVGMGGGAPRAPAGGTVTGGTAMGTGCGCGGVAVWSSAAAAASAAYLPPGARCMVAVGCILAGDGDGGAMPTEPVVMPPTAAGAVELTEASDPVVTVVLLWLTAVNGDGATTGAVAVPVGTVAIPTTAAALRMFWPGTMDRAIPVCGPDTGMLVTVAVGCTIFAILTIGVAHPSSEKRLKNN